METVNNFLKFVILVVILIVLFTFVRGNIDLIQDIDIGSLDNRMGVHPTAVPYQQPVLTTIQDSDGAQMVIPVVPTAIPETTVLRIEKADAVWDLSPEQLINCVNAQQNGLRTGPECPPNAAEHLGMLGQGR